MKRIGLLNDDTAKRIAAGEVITGPVAVVKELVENAIDAGAGHISVDIEDGGREMIRVSDNGSGIHNDDIILAVEKHATSKIQNLNDLGSIATLGFRGEALASIAAVARLTIGTRMHESDYGSVLTVNGGGKPAVEAAGLPDGTTVKVEQLFFNVPARKKFMKTSGREAAQVSSLIAKLILSHPEISIKYAADGKTIYQSPGNGKLHDAMIAVFGSDIADKVIAVDYDNDNTFAAEGFISKPSVIYKTSKNINIFLNGRYIQSKQVTDAIFKGYGERLLHSHFPLAVLNLHIPFANVDINVHPGKLQVMFYDAESVMEDVTAAVDAALRANMATPRLHVPAPAAHELPQISIDIAKNTAPLPNVNSAKTLYTKNDMAADSAAAVMDDMTPGFEKVLDAIIESKEEVMQQPEQTEIDEIRGLASYNVIGQLFDTYLLCECGDALYLIDQHAAHERLNYEDYKKRAGQGNALSQQLLVPVVRKFSQADFTLIGEYMDVFTDLGFEIEEFGALTYRFSALPLAVQKGNVDRLIDEAVYEIKNNRNDIVLARDKVISAACRHSVKAGDKLADSEIAHLIKEITQMDSLPTCPHGRPVAICLTKNDLKKGFKRTV